MCDQWSLGILVKEVIGGKTVEVTLSDVSGQYNNFAIPRVDAPDQLDLNEAKRLLSKNGSAPSIFLTEEQQRSGFVEFLIKHDFRLDARDCWVGYDSETYINKPQETEAIEVLADKFDDYEAVLGPVFAEFPGNEKYLEICRKTLTGEMKNDFPGLKSEFFLIYDNNKPASGAGMFYSKEKNFAYLHDAGTLEQFRGRGYQTNLLRRRINKAWSLGIDRIYSSVEQGSTSWRNCLKIGLNQMQTIFVLVAK